jgi:hypothetical protein
LAITNASRKPTNATGDTAYQKTLTVAAALLGFCITLIFRSRYNKVARSCKKSQEVARTKPARPVEWRNMRHISVPVHFWGNCSNSLKHRAWDEAEVAPVIMLTPEDQHSKNGVYHHVSLPSMAAFLRGTFDRGQKYYGALSVVCAMEGAA